MDGDGWGRSLKAICEDCFLSKMIKNWMVLGINLRK